MTATLIYTGYLQVVTCWCGVGYAMPNDLYREATRTGMSIYCPLGHGGTWGEGENAKLRRQLKAQQDYTAQVNRQLTNEQNRLRATKGVVTKLRKQVLSGECPFCGQHLRDLERHIGRQHPTETAEVETP